MVMGEEYYTMGQICKDISFREKWMEKDKFKNKTGFISMEIGLMENLMEKAKKSGLITQYLKYLLNIQSLTKDLLSLD